MMILMFYESTFLKNMHLPGLCPKTGSVFAGQQVSTGEGRGFSYLLLTLVKVNNRKDRIF